METLLWHLLLYVGSFLLVWFGAGLVVSSVSHLAKSWRLSPFTLSFFLLGILTSLPEIAIGVSAISSGDPSIFMGTLFGGIIVMFLLVIPLLGLVTEGVKMPQQLPLKYLLLIIGILMVPSVLIIDQKLTPPEGIVLIFLYLILFVVFFKKKFSVFNFNILKPKKQANHAWMILKVVAGVVILYVASQQIVNSTMLFATYVHVSPFLMSLLVVSLGTNIPELSIIFRAAIQRQNDIALADYLGSASANVLLFGVLTIIYGQDIVLPSHSLHRLIFLVCGLVIFFIFARSRKTISQQECVLLLFCYVLFLILEILTASAL